MPVNILECTMAALDAWSGLACSRIDCDGEATVTDRLDKPPSGMMSHLVDALTSKSGW
jgi:hypothetical protein